MMESSEKETRAIFLNFKEVRCLEKNMQALDLEKSYNISLINLDQKVVKVKYKRLKDKVSKIKSHLSMDELNELKQMEENGKLNIKTPTSDLNVKISAAEKRLKLLPRAKSAVPRLQQNWRNIDKTLEQVNTPRSARRVQTPIETPRSSWRAQTPNETPRSARKAQTPKDTARSARPALTPTGTLLKEPSRRLHGNATSRSVTPMLDNNEEESNYLVPKSVREDRKKSIDILCVNDEIKELKVPTVNVIAEDDNIDTNSLKGSNLLKKSHDIRTAAFNNGDKTNSLHITSPKNNRKSSLHNTAVVNENTRKDSKSTPDNRKKLDSPTIKVTVAEPDDHIGGHLSPSQSPRGGRDKATVEMGNIDVLNSPRTKLRPMSVPATQITDFGAIPKNNRPKTAIELAVETRKKSVLDIRRASAMLKEGKTRSPFTSHEQIAEEKKEKPFRSIREGINTSNTEYEILDNTLGDDLHREMKKGMILGEVATSLYLEDKIDQFLEKVDGYVKENPNYVYDPNAPKAKREPRVKDQKRPRRNRLRRRQLERRLHEGDVEEMKKSRWLRMDDDKLDISGINTLVVDQMKMLNKLRFPDDDY